MPFGVPRVATQDTELPNGCPIKQGTAVIVMYGAANVDASMTLRDGGAAMGQLKTVAATLKVTKGAITIQGFTLVTAKTSVRLPADSDTTYTVKEQDIRFSLQVVISSGHVYVHLPLSTFRELTGAEATTFPDMAKLFDPKTGLPAIIPAGASPRFVSTDQVGGVSANQIATTYSPEQVRSLLAKLQARSRAHAVAVGFRRRRIA